MKRKFKRLGSSGAALIEFAIVAPLFLLLLLSTLEFGVMLWVNLTMQNAVREGARYAITGQKDLDPNLDRTARTRKNAVLEKIKESSLRLYDRVVDDGGPVVTDVDGHSVSGFGAPGQLVVISLQCSWPIINPLLRPFFEEGTYRFTVSATMRNEMF